MVQEPMEMILEDLIQKLTSPDREVQGSGSLQLAMLLEKNSSPTDEAGFYETVLAPEWLSIELDDQAQAMILMEIAKNKIPAEATASLLWAVGKASPKAGLPVLLRLLSDHDEIMDDENASYQAVIALENCCETHKLEWAQITQDAGEKLTVLNLLKRGSLSLDGRLKEHSSEFLKRLK